MSKSQKGALPSAFYLPVILVMMAVAFHCVRKFTWGLLTMPLFYLALSLFCSVFFFLHCKYFVAAKGNLKQVLKESPVEYIGICLLLTAALFLLVLSAYSLFPMYYAHVILLLTLSSTPWYGYWRRQDLLKEWQEKNA